MQVAANHNHTINKSTLKPMNKEPNTSFMLVKQCPYLPTQSME